MDSSLRIPTISALTQYFRDAGKAARALSKANPTSQISRIRIPSPGNNYNTIVINAQIHAKMSDGSERTFTNVVVDVAKGGTVGDAIDALEKEFNDSIGSHYRVSGFVLDIRAVRGA
jgi:hypothetical protein